MKAKIILILCLLIVVSGCATRLLTSRVSNYLKNNISELSHITVIQPLVKIQKIPGGLNDNYYPAYPAIEHIAKSVDSTLNQYFDLHFTKELSMKYADKLEKQIDEYMGSLQRSSRVEDVSSVIPSERTWQYLRAKNGRYLLVVMQKGWKKTEARHQRDVKKGNMRKYGSTLYVALFDKEAKRSLYYDEKSNFDDPHSEQSIESLISSALNLMIQMKKK